MARPAMVLEPIFRSVHDAAVTDGLGQVTVDVTTLSFMSSSAIRILIAWLGWIDSLAEARRYRLSFKIQPQFNWQRTTFDVLETLGQGKVSVLVAPAD